MSIEEIISSIMYAVEEMKYRFPGREVEICMTYKLFLKIWNEVNDSVVSYRAGEDRLFGTPIKYLIGTGDEWAVGVRGLMPKEET